MEMDFVYLNNDDSLANINLESKVVKPKQYSDEEIPQIDVNLEELQTNIPRLEYKPKVLSEDEVKWLESLVGLEKYYGDASLDDYFKRKFIFWISKWLPKG